MPEEEPLVRRLRDPRWWVTDARGRVVVGQLPNPALGVWLVATLVRRAGLVGDDAASWLYAAGTGALLVWAVDELVRGASPVRRVLGAVVLVPLLATMIEELG